MLPQIEQIRSVFFANADTNPGPELIAIVTWSSQPLNVSGTSHETFVCARRPIPRGHYSNLEQPEACNRAVIESSPRTTPQAPDSPRKLLTDSPEQVAALARFICARICTFTSSRSTAWETSIRASNTPLHAMR
jgi:hypothetical protein